MIGTGTDQTPPVTFSTGGNSARCHAACCRVPVTCIARVRPFAPRPRPATACGAGPLPPEGEWADTHALVDRDVASCFARSHRKHNRFQFSAWPWAAGLVEGGDRDERRLSDPGTIVAGGERAASPRRR